MSRIEFMKPPVDGASIEAMIAVCTAAEALIIALSPRLGDMLPAVDIFPLVDIGMYVGEEFEALRDALRALDVVLSSHKS
ncbi:MAG: hypothetical protein Q7O66_14970 [Dehalococcoidia bacterium]|nr:hypothetical protein [Dehalococcoidia bacterium]